MKDGRRSASALPAGGPARRANISDEEATRILDYLLGERQSMVDLLQRLALAESPTDDPAAVGPVLAILSSEFERIGMAVRRFRGRVSGGMLFARARKSNERRTYQLLVGHCDTVWPVGSVRTMPVHVDGDRLLGPGVFDMKGGLVQMVFALKTVMALGLRPPADCVVVINSDEESGSPDSRSLIRRLARRASRAFVLEPAFGHEGKLKTSRKASGSFEIIVKGRAAHAGVNPEEGVSAILEMSHQIQKLFALNDATRGITVNVGTIDGGLRSNVVAPEARATVDVRVWTSEAAIELEAAIRALRPINPNTVIEIQGGIEQLPMEPLPRNQALWRLAKELGHRLGLDLEQAAVGGASDGNTTSQYTATLDGLGTVGDGAHATHEYALISQMAQRCALLVLLITAPLSPAGPGEGPSGGTS